MRPDVLSPLHITRAMVLNALETLGIKYEASEKEAVMKCPFHGDTKAHCSMNIGEKPGVFQCWHSSCKAKGDLVTFLVEFTGRNGYEVISACRRLSKFSKHQEVLEKHHPWESEEDPLEKYRYRNQYLLEKRGLSEEVQERFHIGYDRNTLQIVIPWFDRSGKLVAIKKRNTTDKGFTYEIGSGPSKTLFGSQHVQLHGYVWIVESEIDAMSLDQVFRMAHFDNHFALALGGNVLSSAQRETLFQRAPEAVVLMLDNDIVGRRSQIEVKKQIIGSVRVYEAEYPPGDCKDANELNYEQIVGLAMQVVTKEEERQNARQARRNENKNTISSS